MYILAIETTGAYASVALIKDGEIIGHIRGNDRFSHLQNLTPQVQSVVAKSEITVAELDAVAVSRGPGSFTGIRIGVSTARALCQALHIPCVPVSSLEALALRAVMSEEVHEMENTLICPILDARRSQIYGGGYLFEGGELMEAVKGAAYTVEEFLRQTAGYERILLMGDGADAYGEAIVESRGGMCGEPAGGPGAGEARSLTTETAPENIRYQDAATVARIAEGEFAKGGGLSYEEVLPDYMRLAEAERKLAEKQNKQNERRG